jgi:DNA polymerase V
MAKRIPADKNGVRIAQLDEMTYREQFWNHRPLTDFWRVGRGISKKLEQHGLFTMGDVARCSLQNEDLLYKLFGINAELLIDHAWGWEPTIIADIKSYRPESNSLSSGQVLQEPYPFEKAKLVMREMTDSLILDLVEKGLVTDQLVITVGYDIENLTDPDRRKSYTGEITTDFYGRQIPKYAHGTVNLGRFTSSTRLSLGKVAALFDRIVDPNLLVRRLNITANHVVWAESAPKGEEIQQLDLFSDPAQMDRDEAELRREQRRQKAVLHIRKKYGKNALIKGMNLEEGATAMDRNKQIGGHKA